MDDDNDDIYTEVATGITSTSYTQAVSTEGDSYKFRVRARNQIGLSEYSSVFTILAAVVPDEPVNFVRDQGQTTENQVTFTWSAPADDGANTIIDYSVEMYNDNDSAFQEVATGLTSTTYTETSLTPGTIYRFRVRA